MSGRCVKRLLELLNESFPEKNGLPIEWLERDMHPAKGAWRKKSMDVWSWQAYATYKDTGGTAFGVGSYATMTELIKFKRLEMHGDEIYGMEAKAE